PEFDAGNLDRYVGLLADRVRLAKRLERAVRFVADVTHIEAAVPRGDLRELHELLRLAVAPDFVLEAARESDRAFAHALIDELRHARDLVVARGPLVVVAHHLATDGRMTDHHEHVERGGMPPALGQIVRDRPRRRPVRADDDCRDPLRDLTLRRRTAGEPLGRVIVNVDETRRDGESAGVDDSIAVSRFHRADRDDAVPFDADVAAAKR